MTPSSFQLPDPAGFDPYDALRSSRVPDWMRQHAGSRQAVIQLRKRLPWDLSSLLGIRPFVMSKTLGCHLTALSRSQVGGRSVEESEASGLVTALDATEGNLGEGAWGYEFDVQTRWAFYPAGSPNLIATAFVGRALCLAGVTYGRADWTQRGRASADFALRELARRDEAGRTVFFYTRDTEHMVHNANLLGAALCAAAAYPGRRQESTGEVLSACAATIAAQRTDGSWPYGDTPSLSWVDSFHTAYVLDGLLQAWLLTGDEAVGTALERGLAYWKGSFFGSEGEPWYYDSPGPPYDIHAAATAVDVGARLASWGFLEADVVRRVASWTESNLIDPETGATFYRKGRWGVDRRHFARWGDAHWALARASLAMLNAGGRDRLESSLREEG